MDGVELAGLPPSIAEARQHLQGLAVEDVDALVRAVGHVQILLLWVPRNSDIECRSVAERVGFDPSLLHELSVCCKRLDAVVGTVADVDHAVIRKRDRMHGCAELIRLVAWLVCRQLRVVWLIAIRTPVPLVLAGIRVKHDHPPVAVAIGNV